MAVRVQADRAVSLNLFAGPLKLVRGSIENSVEKNSRVKPDFAVKRPTVGLDQLCIKKVPAKSEIAGTFSGAAAPEAHPSGRS